MVINWHVWGVTDEREEGMEVLVCPKITIADGMDVHVGDFNKILFNYGKEGTTTTNLTPELNSCVQIISHELISGIIKDARVPCIANGREAVYVDLLGDPVLVN